VSRRLIFNRKNMIFGRTKSKRHHYLVWVIFLLKLKCNCYIVFLGFKGCSTASINPPTPAGVFMNSEKQLYRHDRLFQLMADNVLDGVAIIENQKVIYVNNRLCEITGYTHEELFELDSFEIIAPEMRKGIKRDYGDHEKIKLFEEREYEIVRKDGERRVIYNRHSHMTNDAGNKIFYHFEIITDITDRKLAEEKLKTLNLELEQRVEQRTSALSTTNEQLKKEIKERAQAEKELKFRELELEA